jgi:exopolysaccharide biosynthesis polyprenyl glycosylphosphotransferase
MKRSELFFTALLIPLDAVMLFLAFAVAYYLRDNVTLVSPEFVGSISSRIQYNPATLAQPFTQYLHYIWYLIPGLILIFALTGLYSLKRSMRFWERFGRIILGVSMGLFFILLLFLFKKDFFLPRTTVLYSWVLGIAFVTIGRALLRLLQRVFYKKGIGRVRVGVIGSSEMARALVKRLNQGWSAQYALAEIEGDEVETLLPQVDRDILDELIVVNEKFSVDELTQLRNRCLEQHVSFGFLPRAFTAMQGAAYDVRQEVGLPIIEVRPTPLDGWARIVKRSFDIVVSLILVVIVSPLYLLIAILQKASAPKAPIIVKNRRIGRGGKYIIVSKYRSMKPDWTDQNGKLSQNFQNYLATHPEANKEWIATAKLKDDPRISSLGKFLRATRLDELPQFLDVLRGDLSLVGPRPIVDWEKEKFGDTLRILFHVRPGITGPWQVEGGNSLPYEERVRLNTYYIEHWNLWLDVVILAKTGWLVISGVFAKLVGKQVENEGL